MTPSPTLATRSSPQGERGPPARQAREGDARAHLLLFHTDRSTLPYRVGFPVFVSNLVPGGATGRARRGRGRRTGVLPPLAVAPRRSYRVEGPGGLRRDERTDDRGQLTGLPAPLAGEYTLTDGTTAARTTSAPACSPPPRPPSPPWTRSNSTINSASPPPPPSPKRSLALVGTRLRRLRRAARRVVVVPAPAGRGVKANVGWLRSTPAWPAGVLEILQRTSASSIPR